MKMFMISLAGILALSSLAQADGNQTETGTQNIEIKDLLTPDQVEESLNDANEVRLWEAAKKIEALGVYNLLRMSVVSGYSLSKSLDQIENKTVRDGVQVAIPSTVLAVYGYTVNYKSGKKNVARVKEARSAAVKAFKEARLDIDAQTPWKRVPVAVIRSALTGGRRMIWPTVTFTSTTGGALLLAVNSGSMFMTEGQYNSIVAELDVRIARLKKEIGDANQETVIAILDSLN